MTQNWVVPGADRVSTTGADNVWPKSVWTPTNNPGNLMHPIPGTNFKQYALNVYPDPEAGLGAMVDNILAYRDAGINTLDGLAKHWASGPKDDPGKYAKDLVGRTGLQIAQPYDAMDPTTLAKLTDGIIWRENSADRFSAAQIDDVVQKRLALYRAKIAQAAQPLPPPVLRPEPAPATPPNKSYPIPMLRPAPTPPVHPSMNEGPSVGLNLAQYQAAPAAAAQVWSGGRATSQQGTQPAFALASRGPVPLPQPTSQPPSPFIQAFLNNAIFGSPAGARFGSMPGLDPTSQLPMASGFNGSSPLSLSSAGPAVWPWGRRGS